MSAGTTRTPRLAPEIRRGQIISATLVVAERQGFPALTIDAIAAEAGITRPVVYDLFGDLEGLLAATVADAAARAMASVDAALPTITPDSSPERLLDATLRTFLDAVRADPLTWKLILVPSRGAPAEIRAAVVENRNELVDRVTPLVSWGLAQLDVPDAVDRAILARLLIATGEDMARLTLAHPRRYPPDRIATAVGQLAQLLPSVMR